MKLSKYIKDSNVLEMTYEGLECTFCGEKTKVGGLWNVASNDNFVICINCKETLVEFLVDTLNDIVSFNCLSDTDKLEYISAIAKKKLIEDKANERWRNTVQGEM